MAVEIEHKYLVTDNSYKAMAFEKLEIVQGYLNRNIDRTVRIRTVNDKGFLTVKGKTIGDIRPEFEYEIPFLDAKEILKLAEPGIIEKTRYLVNYEGQIWEVDEFHGQLKGVTIAEIEIEESGASYHKPPFIGIEITGDPKYYNSILSNNSDK